jgi:lycopene beta-cyclase
VRDVLVVGGGPAGRVLAGACAARGLDTALLDPAPDRPWRITYGAWAGELPPDLPDAAVAARARGRVVALTARDLGWEYAVLDVPGLRAHLDGGLAGMTLHAGRAVGLRAPDSVGLADGATLAARVVVDAGGYRQPLRGEAAPARAAAEQTAYGLAVAEADAAALVRPGEALFMDWTRAPGVDPADWPSFLYGIPLGGGAVLLEETSLARRPGLPVAHLRTRLLARLARHGVPSDGREERVRFPVDSPRHRSPTALGFGAAAPLVHPATGFSVATALRAAPAVAAALAAHLPADPQAARATARSVLWPPEARIVHALRHRGLEALLRMPPAQVPAFFEVFFDLPERHRWAYLTGRDDLPGTLAALGALFGRAGWGLRARLVGLAR